MELNQDNNTMPLKDGFNFTPIFNGNRVRMRVSWTNGGLVRGRGYRGQITDADTGIRYDVYGRSCGLPSCYCDAWIREASDAR